MDWQLDDNAAPNPLETVARGRAKTMLARYKRRLPKLSEAQADLIVSMMVHAYRVGRDARNTMQWVASISGANKRRQLAAQKRASFLQAFEAAAANGGDANIEKLATQFGISRAAAYRYLRPSKPITSRRSVS